MSKYLTFNDICIDEATLLAALEALGYPADKLEWGKDLPLYGYMGDRRPETADIVIRRRHLQPGSNDIGFKRTERGLVPIISDFDRRWLVIDGRPFPVALKLQVNTRKAEQLVQRFGGVTTRQRANGKLVITVTR